MIARCPVGSCSWWLRLPKGYLRLNPFGKNCFINTWWMNIDTWEYLVEEYA